MLISRHALATLLTGFLIAVAGCADHPSEVPLDGEKVAEGNSKLMYKPSQPGEVFVYEDPGNKIIYRAGVRAGDVIELDARHNEITLNGRTVAEKNLDTSRTYKIYFDPRSSRRHRN